MVNDTVKQTVRNLETIAFDPDLARELVNEMLNDHRTHQQRFMALLVRYLNEAAVRADKGQYDDRNESSAKLAQKIRDSDVLVDVYLPVI